MGKTERVKVIEGCSWKVKKNIVMEAGQGTVGGGILSFIIVAADSIVSSDSLCGSVL